MNKLFVVDLAERTAATYVQAVGGLLLADSTHLLSLGAFKACAVAALPAALAVVKGALAGSVGTSGTASLVPQHAPAAALPVAVGAPEGAAQ